MTPVNTLGRILAVVGSTPTAHSLPLLSPSVSVKPVDPVPFYRDTHRLYDLGGLGLVESYPNSEYSPVTIEPSSAPSGTLPTESDPGNLSRYPLFEFLLHVLRDYYFESVNSFRNARIERTCVLPLGFGTVKID